MPLRAAQQFSLEYPARYRIGFKSRNSKVRERGGAVLSCALERSSAREGSWQSTVGYNAIACSGPIPVFESGSRHSTVGSETLSLLERLLACMSD